MMSYAFFDGEVVPSEEARVSIASHSLQYGTTCFGGLRGRVEGESVQLFRLKDHHTRLMKACKMLGFDYSISFEAFNDALTSLVASNTPDGDFYVRPFVFCPEEKLGPRFDTLNYDLAIYMMSISNYLAQDRGLNLCISSWRKYPDTCIPTKAKAGGAYLNSSLATTEAKLGGFDEAIMLDHEGYVAEGSVMNLLIVYRGEVIVPQVGSPILDGITMRTVVELLRDADIPIRFERIDRSMLYAADELILTGTAAQVAYADSVDRRSIGAGEAGPICQLLRKGFTEIYAGNHPRSEEWVTTLTLARAPK